MNPDPDLSLSEVLGGLAFLIHVVTFLVYNRKMVRGESQPNTATWGVWAFVASLNFASYFFMSRDWIKSLQPMAGALACIGTFIFAYYKGRLTRLGKTDAGILAIGLGAATVWFIHQNATYANLILQTAFIISFIPTLRDTWHRPEKESPTPWFMWGSVYLILIVTVLLRWQGNPPELVYPVLSFACHSSVGVLVLKRRKR